MPDLHIPLALIQNGVFLYRLQSTLQRTNAENSEQIFPEQELFGHSPNFHNHLSVSNFYIPTIDLPILLQENMWTDPGNI